jgi:hypothetical protein
MASSGSKFARVPAFASSFDDLARRVLLYLPQTKNLPRLPVAVLLLDLLDRLLPPVRK